MEHINCKEEANVTVSEGQAVYTFVKSYTVIPKPLIDTYVGSGQVGNPVVTLTDVTFPVTGGDGDTMEICIISKD